MTTDKPICSKCGKIHVTWHGHPSCTAHKKRTNPPEPCPNPPRNGLGVCRIHGGNTPVALAMAEQKLALMSAQGEIAQLMREVDIPDQHPLDGLLEVVRVSGAMMRLLTIKVGELAEDAEVREVIEENFKTGDVRIKQVTDNDAFWGLDKDGQMVAHTYVQLLRIWTERYERACKTALDAGIDERRIRLAEDTADTFFSALSKAVAAADLTPKQMEMLMQSLAKQLRTDPDVIELEAAPDDEDLI